jgi:hypothetical protein
MEPPAVSGRIEAVAGLAEAKSDSRMTRSGLS